jgi:hypothetical protein
MATDTKSPDSHAYLGDSVYIKKDSGGQAYILYTSNGGLPTNVIWLGLEVVESLKKFLELQA